MIAKIIYPETEKPKTVTSKNIHLKTKDTNAMDAIGRGATDGMKLAANVAAMLIAFISMVAMVNFLLGYANTSLQEILGILFNNIPVSFKPLIYILSAYFEKKLTEIFKINFQHA